MCLSFIFNFSWILELALFPWERLNKMLILTVSPNLNLYQHAEHRKVRSLAAKVVRLRSSGERHSKKNFIYLSPRKGLHKNHKNAFIHILHL